MNTICDPSNSEVCIFSFKQPGLFSAAGHDLKLKVARFRIDVSKDSVVGEFEAGSLEAECAMIDGSEERTSLSRATRAEIEKTIREKILSASRYPMVRFKSTDVSSSEVRGQLTLCGETRELLGRRSTDGTRAIAEFRFVQSRFGIRPFTALLGALKIRDEILVRVSIDSESALAAFGASAS